MIQKLKIMLLSVSTLLFFAAPLAVGGVAYAATPTQDDINNGLNCGSDVNLDPNATCTTNTTAGKTASELASTVINVLSLLVGVVAVIMLIFAGFRYVTSGGKQESVTSAKNMILYAIVGLVVVALAQLIVHFVLNNLNSATA